MTLGITPTRPETGYGYLQCGGADRRRPGARGRGVQGEAVVRRGRGYVKSGNYLWNAGMFVWRVDVFLAELSRQQPQLAAGISPDRAGLGLAGARGGARRGLADAAADLGRLRGDGGRGRASAGSAPCPATSAGTTSATSTRSARCWPPTPRATSVVGKEAWPSRACCCARPRTWSSCRTRAGWWRRSAIRDLIIVDTPDAVLVCPRDRAQEVKHLVDQLKELGEHGLLSEPVRSGEAPGREPCWPADGRRPAGVGSASGAEPAQCLRLVADPFDRAGRAADQETHVVVERRLGRAAVAPAAPDRVDVHVDRVGVELAGRGCRTPRWPRAAPRRPASGRPARSGRRAASTVRAGRAGRAAPGRSSPTTSALAVTCPARWARVIATGPARSSSSVRVRGPDRPRPRWRASRSAGTASSNSSVSVRSAEASPQVRLISASGTPSSRTVAVGR